MRQYKKMTVAVLSLLCLSAVSLQAESSGCARCDDIREYNKEHHKNYNYYEDYEKVEQKEIHQRGSAQRVKGQGPDTNSRGRNSNPA